MKRGTRVYLATCAATVAFALGYALPAYSRLPNLFYAPIEHRFLVAGRPGYVQMGYYGQNLWGLACAIAVGGLVFLVTGRMRARPSESTLALAGAWALTFLGLVGAYFTWQNWP